MSTLDDYGFIFGGRIITPSSASEEDSLPENSTPVSLLSTYNPAPATCAENPQGYYSIPGGFVLGVLILLVVLIGLVVGLYAQLSNQQKMFELLIMGRGGRISPMKGGYYL